MKPKPWSYSSLDDFVNCPKAFYEKRIAKSVQEEKSEQMIWGERVHKVFEDYVNDGNEVPLHLLNLEEHQPYLDKIRNADGHFFCEQKVGFDKSLKPCNFMDHRNVWWRGIIDVKVVFPEKGKARLIDYKTGKPHTKFKQLDLFALHTYELHPEVEEIHSEFYWTKTCSTTGKRTTRADIPNLWMQFMPDLKQYAEAFRTDVWQPRPSGLCNGWCPVTDCEFWKPKRVK